MRRSIILLFALAVALAWRLPKLANRPMHGDEANQAVRTGMLMDEGRYRYDPTDHHGPVLYFAALPFCRATASRFADTTEWNYRLVPVAFSLLTLALMAAFGKLFLNDGGLAAALLLVAMSPLMVYYNRFFIQETMLATFLAGMFLCGWKWCTASRKAAWAAGFGVSAGLAMATKETVVLSFAAAGVAGLAAFGWRRIRAAWSWRDAAIAGGIALAVAALFFSSFFTYPHGIHDALFSTVSAYIHRATGVPEHQHPWHFYFDVLFWFRYGRGPVWSEAGILAPALIAIVWAWRRKQLAVRFLAIYTIALSIIYSAIPYKTPWCALTFLHGWLVLAGVGMGVLWNYGKTGIRCACVLLLAVLLWREGVQSWRAAYKYPADPRNPYVYAHTGTDAMNLVAAVKAAAAKAQGLDTPIALAVPTPDTWPLPWYLRAYRNVGYWTKVEEIPAEFAPAVLIVAADQGDVAEMRFGKGKRAAFYGIRPGTLLNLFIEE